jgi:hypothetical protein
MTRPNPHIALIYHYDLARALDGEPVDWQAIPVNVDAGREGGDLCRAAADFGKRRDLFAMPAPRAADPDVILATVDLSGSESPGPPGEAATGGIKLAAPAATSSAVEQSVVDPEPPTASSVVPVSAADRMSPPCPRHAQAGFVGECICPANTRDRLRARIRDLIGSHIASQDLLRLYWPEGVPTLKHEGHTDDQLAQILTAVRRVEAEVGAPFHPDDGAEPRSRAAAQRALAAWGDDINGAWFAASLIATFEQCRQPDCTLDGLVGQFTIEQCERLYDAAPPF